MKVLVAYASRHGSTKGIAERLAETLASEGLEVTTLAVDEVESVAPFDAFVVGSAAYMGGWLKEAGSFVRRHAPVLSVRPTWLFSSGPIGTDRVDKQGRDVVEASVPHELRELAPAVASRGEKVFFGAWDPTAEPAGLAERLFSGVVRAFPSLRQDMPVGDFRDWPEIEAWAREIAAELRREPIAVG